jgi:hypothetical protein
VEASLADVDEWDVSVLEVLWQHPTSHGLRRNSIEEEEETRETYLKENRKIKQDESAQI